MNPGGTEHRPTKKQWIAAFIILPSLALLVAVLTLFGDWGNSGDTGDTGVITEPVPSSSHLAGPATTVSTSTPRTTSSIRPVPTTTSAATPPRPTQSYLNEFKALNDGGLRAGSAEVNGEVYPHSLYANIGGCRTSGRYAYNIGRDYNTFETTVGLRDDTESASVVQFEIFADDVPVYTSGNMSVGQSVPVSIPVDNVLQLKIGYVFVDGNMNLCSDAGNVVWGDPTLR